MKGSLKRIGALFYARTLEFVRDRAALVWNLLFPLLLVIGFSLIFSGPPKPLVQIGVVGELPATYAPLRAVPLLKIIPYDEASRGQLKVRHHQLDLLLSPAGGRYWVNPDAPQGAMAEYLLRQAVQVPLQRETLSGRAIRYGDWLLPGVIGMNLMFSGLFGVGFVIVRYRKNGVLKRLRATQLGALEFLFAQLLSRVLITLVVSLLVFCAAYWLLDVPLIGSGWLLLVIALAGGTAMASLGLLIAARLQNEELASGLLNLISLPMMFLSGVWFSLEGAPAWLQQLAARLPLSQIIEAARAVMLEGRDGRRWQALWVRSWCSPWCASRWEPCCSNGVQNETCSVVVAGGGLACAGRYPALQERLADRGRHHGRAAGSLRPADAQGGSHPLRGERLRGESDGQVCRALDLQLRQAGIHAVCHRRKRRYHRHCGWSTGRMTSWFSEAQPAGDEVAIFPPFTSFSVAFPCLLSPFFHMESCRLTLVLLA